jgi:hypothetical protein
MRRRGLFFWTMAGISGWLFRNKSFFFKGVRALRSILWMTLIWNRQTLNRGDENENELGIAQLA